MEIGHSNDRIRIDREGCIRDIERVSSPIRDNSESEEEYEDHNETLRHELQYYEIIELFVKLCFCILNQIIHKIYKMQIIILKNYLL